MPRKLTPARMLLALAMLVLVLFSVPSASASSLGPALRYRVVHHARAYDVVRGHSRTLHVGDGHNYVTIGDVRRFRVVRHNRYYVLLRQILYSNSAAAGSTSSDGVVSVGSAVAASSSEKGHQPSNANDGQTTTRWAAGSRSYPQTWTVDLGQDMSLARVAIAWYRASSRAYRYRILTSSDGVTFATAADRSANQATGRTSDPLTGTARYVRVEVLGVTPSAGWASAYEVTVYGANAIVPATDTLPTPEPSPSATPEPSPSATPEPSPSATPEPTPSTTPQPTPTPTATGLPAPASDPIAAITRARAGDTVVVPAGTFDGGTTLAIPDGVTVIGQGRELSWLRSTVSFGSNTVLRGLKLGPAAAASVSAIRNRAGASHVLIEDCRLRGGGGTDVSVVKLGEGGNDASDITFRNNLIEANLGSWNVISIRENVWSGGAHIEHVTFDGNDIGVPNGVTSISPRAGLELWENDQPNGAGTERVEPAHHMTDLVITNNTFERTGEFSLDLSDTSRNGTHTHAGPVTITHNVLRGGGARSGASWGYTICIECPQNVEVAYNTIYRASNNTISLTSGLHLFSTEGHLNGPYIHDNLIDARTDNGITPGASTVYLRGENWRFVNNTVIGSGTQTIFKIESCLNGEVAGNTVTTNGSTVWKLWLDTITDLTTSPNTIL